MSSYLRAWTPIWVIDQVQDQDELILASSFLHVGEPAGLGGIFF